MTAKCQLSRTYERRVLADSATSKPAGEMTLSAHTDICKFLARQALLEAHFTSCGAGMVSTPGAPLHSIPQQ
jgi:hypothetical protein